MNIIIEGDILINLPNMKYGMLILIAKICDEIVHLGYADVVNKSPSGAGHLNKIKYTETRLGMTAILGCCRGYACTIPWVLVIKGTFQCELEMNRVVDLKHKVKRIVKRLSCNVTEVESKGAQI